MCGIAGFVGEGSRSDLESMIASLSHRGPDGRGDYLDEQNRVFLGFRRLAIYDIAGGHQPMLNENGDIIVVFNGEIYNQHELRKELIERGHRFSSSHSDTEVIVHGYEEWGENLPLRLNGMFAFAVYDKVRRSFFLARDRFGEKPLYFTARPGFFAFASELSSLVSHHCVSRTISSRAVAKLFAYGYLPAPTAILEGTEKLQGGCWLRYDLDTATKNIKSYWSFSIEPDESLRDADEPELVEELRCLLITATRRRLMSDVPVGLFLSGGLDSSSILGALASNLISSKIHTFNIGFNEVSFDESIYANRVAQYFATDHHHTILDLDEAKSLIPKVLYQLDEPLGDASILPTYLLSRFAREKVKVALTGDGGDELFAGYDPFAALTPASIYDKLVPKPFHRGIVRIIDLLPFSDRNMSLDFKLRRTLMGLGVDNSMRLPVWMAPLDADSLCDLMHSPVYLEDIYEEAIFLWKSDPRKCDLDRSLEFYTNFYLRDNILSKSDRASMMCGLEVRAVFLDNDLVDFCRRLPAHFKYRNGVRKYLLKKAAALWLPADIINRTKKGFGIPISKWLRSMPLEQVFNSYSSAGNDFANKALKLHREQRKDYRLFLWTWMSFKVFSRRIAGD
jgi:asparagine synthase (glutamine-hydrolysing)